MLSPREKYTASAIAVKEQDATPGSTIDLTSTRTYWERHHTCTADSSESGVTTRHLPLADHRQRSHGLAVICCASGTPVVCTGIKTQRNAGEGGHGDKFQTSRFAAERRRGLVGLADGGSEARNFEAISERKLSQRRAFWEPTRTLSYVKKLASILCAPS